MGGGAGTTGQLGELFDPPSCPAFWNCAIIVGSLDQLGGVPGPEFSQFGLFGPLQNVGKSGGTNRRIV